MGKRISTGSAFRFRNRSFHGLSGLDGKPFHPPLTDIPVGAYIIAPVLDVIAFFGRTQQWAGDVHTAAGYTLLVGAAFSLATVATGLADWMRTTAGTDLRRMVNAHALTMVATTIVVLANLALRFLGDADAASAGLLALSILVMVLVTLGGMIGGSLVYDKGFNVRHEDEVRRAV